MSAAATVEALEAAGVVAVVRANSPEGAVSAARALVAGGITAIEITFTTPGTAHAIEEVRRRLPGALVGAGTVVSRGQAEEAAAAGALFLVSPHTDPELVAAADEHGLLALPGALTPTEVVRAMALSPVIKLFPAGVGGVGLLKALRGPLPALRCIPTGGVTAANAGEWLEAGAVAVGAGSDLCPPALIAAGGFDAIETRARGYAAALARSRGAELEAAR